MVSVQHVANAASANEHIIASVSIQRIRIKTAVENVRAIVSMQRIRVCFTKEVVRCAIVVGPDRTVPKERIQTCPAE